MIALTQHAPASDRALPFQRLDMPTIQEDIAYYRRRLSYCIEQAQLGTCASSRRAHQELSRLYREKLAALGALPVSGTDAHGPGGLVQPPATLSGLIP